MRRFIDIGANLTDPMFQGVYHGKQKHGADLGQVLQRAYGAGLERIMVTAGTLEEARAALALCRDDARLVTTVGVHPTRCSQEFSDAEQGAEYLRAMTELCAANPQKIVAVGELGLDYERLNFCPKEHQLTWFERQLDVAEATGKPLFLHNRNSADDLVAILSRNRSRFGDGVVHSFDGTLDEARRILDLGLYIGINGCSLRTTANLETVAQLPLDRLMVETDAPWCGIKASHPSSGLVKTQFPAKKKERWEEGFLVKDRNEPCTVVQVVEVVAAAMSLAPDQVAEAAFANAARVFFKGSLE